MFFFLIDLFYFIFTILENAYMLIMIIIMIVIMIIMIIIIIIIIIIIVMTIRVIMMIMITATVKWRNRTFERNYSILSIITKMRILIIFCY